MIATVSIASNVPQSGSPTFSGIVAERDASRQRQADARAKSEEALEQELASRATIRRQLSKGSDPAKAGIFASIEAFDNDPSNKNRRILLETATSVPDRSAHADGYPPIGHVSGQCAKGVVHHNRKRGLRISRRCRHSRLAVPHNRGDEHQL